MKTLSERIEELDLEVISEEGVYRLYDEDENTNHYISHDFNRFTHIRATENDIFKGRSFSSQARSILFMINKYIPSVCQ